ncbi:DUF4838 domain-containing protein [Microbacterium sp. 2MCAF23]|uniref:DUF4838 domain-containing protein n=1 Tax=Microbacterium sp. 2MCAF23 TaxID=3232985 RepID=UPI003F94ABEC
MPNDNDAGSGITRRTLLQASGIATAAAAVTLAAPAQDAHASTTLTVSSAGATTYSIYVGATEDAIVMHAANELAAYLGRITGAAFPIVLSTDPTPTGPCFIVGATTALAGAVEPNLASIALGEDGFVFRTDANGNILIAGNHSRGTLNGVYFALDRILGVRWFSDSFETVPSHPTLVMSSAEFTRDEVPRFRFRNIMSGDVTDPTYIHRNLLNGRAFQHIPVTTPAGVDTWSQYFPDIQMFLASGVDASKRYGGQILMMDSAARSQLTTYLLNNLEWRVFYMGGPRSYQVNQNDTVWTPDSDSAAFAALHGDALSAPLVDMMNEVAAGTVVWYPDVQLSMQAYQWSLKPPTGLTVHPNMAVVFAPIDANFATSLFEGSNTEVGEFLTDWCDVSANMIVWNYTGNFRNYLQPYPDYHAHPESIKDIAAHSEIQGYFSQSPFDTPGLELAAMRLWVHSRLLWDPSLNASDLIQEFVNGFFGPAAPFVSDYIDLMVSALESTSSSLSCLSAPVGAYLRYETMRDADALLTSAFAAVSGNAQYTLHLQPIRATIDYIILLRRANFSARATELGQTWDPDTTNRLARLQADLAAIGMEFWTGDSSTIAELVALLSIERTAAVVPDAAIGLLPQDWVDFQDPDLVLDKPNCTLLADPLASDGYAIKLPGNLFSWFLQMRLNSLPVGRDWKLFVRLRVDPGTATASSLMMRYGVYAPPIWNDYADPVPVVADGAYHEIELQGTYTNSNLLFYFGGFDNNLLGDVYVDRVFAIATDPAPNPDAPAVTVKEGSEFTVQTGDSYDMVSFKLHARQKIDRVILNGVVKDLTNNEWSDVNFIKPGVFGAKKGRNSLVAYDTVGNGKLVQFILN